MFVVIHTEAVPDSLTGYLSRYLYELEPGLFVGTSSRRLFESLWKQVERWAGSGHAVAIRSCGGEQGFALYTHNHPTLMIADLDGLSLPIVRSREPTPASHTPS